jgi:DNA mismatch repair ATPase MutL
MPSLGFLKKKRTKDSTGSHEVASPTSPTIGSPISQTLSKQSNTFPEQEQQQQQQTASTESSTQQNTTTSQSSNARADDSMNISTQSSSFQQPQQYNGSQHDSAHESNGQHQHQNLPSVNINKAPTINPLRETKGKYALNDFTISRTLGTGSFGRVHLVQSKHNQRFYAVKVLKKAQVYKMKQVEHTNDERKMLQRCRNPFLITLWGTWQDSKNLYMVMDFIEGGELFSLLRKSQVRMH